MSRWQRIVLLPDMQAPYHDPRFVRTLVEFVRDYAPDELVHVGDHFDSPEVGRWNRGYAGEYAGSFWDGIEAGKRILADFRDVYAGRFRLKSGNHDERVETYVHKYAPALDSVPGLRMENLFGLDEYEIQLERYPFKVAPGWYVAHGHEGSLRHTAGGTAIALARKIGHSVVCGHTHKVGLISESHGLLGKIQTLTGMEVGNAMDMRQAHYLKTGAANWQQGFGILHVKGSKVIPQPVTATGGTFVVDGREYGPRA